MKNLKEKLRKNGGFTLVEMLIVVAIIAILIAVSIPMVGSALEKSRHAVDQANVRDAISLGSVKYLSDQAQVKKDAGTNKVAEYSYIVDQTTHQGRLEATGTAVPASCNCNGAVGEGLKVKISLATGEVMPNWTCTGNGTVANDAYKTWTGETAATPADPDEGT